jgi:maltose/moltooligosaccharide transporter
VVYSFYTGAAVLLTSILITVFTTSEYPPEYYDKEIEEEKPKKVTIPKIMMQLLLVQFFSWFALFSMWVYTTPAIADHFYNSPDPNSTGYQEAGNWVGILFGIYNGVSAMVALLLRSWPSG